MAVRKQVPLYYKPKNMVPPNGWTSGAHAIVNIVRAVFLTNKQLLFILVLATDQGNNGVVRGLWPV